MIPNTPAPSTRAKVVTRRTYNRPLDEQGNTFETWPETVDRVKEHQRWLWERASGHELTEEETQELEALADIMKAREASVSGRTLWLGGTPVARTREASQFNCSFGEIQTVHDVVDAFWLLLQGCGVGFKPVKGTLNGLTQKAEIQIIRSEKVIGDPKGREHNISEVYVDEDTDEKVYLLTVGDSAEAWAKAAGKLLAMKHAVDRIVVDFSEVRAAGIRLKGYGWISSGDETISEAFEAILDLLNRRAGKLLTAIDIMDVLNWLGTTLSSRRSAEITTLDVNHPEVDKFISAKKNFFNYWNEETGEEVPVIHMTPEEAAEKGFHQRGHRQQSNNSIVFYDKPTKWELRYIFDTMMRAGGSEPGFLNGTTALARGPWFKGVNPCAEIILGDKSFCNLVEIDWGKFDINELSEFRRLERTIYLAARANYRQTCVNLRDGVLQDAWHELNEFLRLCGVGATGIVKLLDRIDETKIGPKSGVLRRLREAAHAGANGMADELGLPRPKAVTTIKPSGTLSKVMDTTEGIHRPLGRYMFNNITFSKHDPLVPVLEEAGYHVREKPFEAESVLVTFPVAYEDVKFDVVERDGEELHVNLESAVDQLDRYKLVMDNYVDHNCSITISYDPEEVPAIVDWLSENWDTYLGVSWVYRTDPTMSAEEAAERAGYAYLPQEVVTKSKYDAYVSKLQPVSLDGTNTFEELAMEDCAGGACPIK